MGNNTTYSLASELYYWTFEQPSMEEERFCKLSKPRPLISEILWQMGHKNI